MSDDEIRTVRMRALHYAVHGGEYLRTWWVCRNMELMELKKFKEVDPRFWKQFRDVEEKSGQ